MANVMVDRPDKRFWFAMTVVSHPAFFKPVPEIDDVDDLQPMLTQAQ